MPATGPYRTQSDLINEALANLGVLSAGQITDLEDYSYVQEKLDSIVRKLAGLEVAYIPDINNIPSAFFSDLADIVAGECASKFGQAGQGLADLVNKGLGGATGPAGPVRVGGGAAAMSLKQMMRGRYTGEVLPVEYF
jgi:hypothetical protein